MKKIDQCILSTSTEGEPDRLTLLSCRVCAFRSCAFSGRSTRRLIHLAHAQGHDLLFDKGSVTRDVFREAKLTESKSEFGGQIETFRFVYASFAKYGDAGSTRSDRAWD